MWASFRGACAAREPGIHTPGAVVMGSGLAASDLGFTRDRHWIMRTSATADVRRRPGTTSDAVGIARMECRSSGTSCGAVQDGQSEPCPSPPYGYAFLATGTGMPAILRLTEPSVVRLV